MNGIVFILRFTHSFHWIGGASISFTIPPNSSPPNSGQSVKMKSKVNESRLFISISLISSLVISRVE